MANLQDLLTELERHEDGDFDSAIWSDSNFTDEFFSEANRTLFDLEDELDFLRNLLDKGPFLDLGCGSGRLYKTLHKDFEGLALDISFQALKTDSDGSDTTLLVQGDLNRLPVKGRFELIILGFGQICFLERSAFEKLLNQCKKLLKRGGHLVIDLPSIEYIQEMHGANEWQNVGEQLWFYSREYDPASAIFSQKLTRLCKSTKVIETRSFSYQMYSLYELLDLFNSQSYRVVYGSENYQQSPIKEGSQWMIFALQKK